MSQCFCISIPTYDTPAKIMVRNDNRPQIAKNFLWRSMGQFRHSNWSSVKDKHHNISAYQTHLYFCLSNTPTGLCIFLQKMEIITKIIFSVSLIGLSHCCCGQATCQQQVCESQRVPREEKATLTRAAAATGGEIPLQQLCPGRCQAETKLSSFVSEMGHSSHCPGETQGSAGVQGPQGTHGRARAQLLCAWRASAGVPPQHCSPWRHLCSWCHSFPTTHFCAAAFFCCQLLSVTLSFS